MRARPYAPGPDVWTDDLRPLVPARLPISGVHMALGPRVLPSWTISSLCPLLARGLRVYWIDARGSFDAYGLGRAAQALRLDPRSILTRVRLARPFNIFQLEAIITRKLPALWGGEPVVLADPLVPFIDEDLPVEQARGMLPRILEGIRRLRAPWLVLMVERETPKGREGVAEAFLREAGNLARLEQRDGGWRLLPAPNGGYRPNGDSARRRAVPKRAPMLPFPEGTGR